MGNGILTSIGKCRDCQDHNINRGKQKIPITNDMSTKLSVTPDTPIKCILERSLIQQRFRSFLKTKWEPSSSDDTYFKSEGKSIALNFLDFCIEVKGALLYCPYFCHFRACNIFEKYLMHGATELIPISKLVVDECARLIYGTETEELDPNLFTPAIVEAMDFLLTEVYPFFAKTSRVTFSKQNSAELAVAMKLKVMAVMRAPLRNEVSIVYKLLRDSTYRKALCGYCNRVDGANTASNDSDICGGAGVMLLSAYDRLQTIERDIKTLCDDSEVNFVIFMHWIHALYVDFLLPIAPSMVGLSCGSKTIFLQKLSKCKSPSYEALQVLEDSIVDALRIDYLDGFLSSPEHTLVMRTGRRTVHLLATAPASCDSPSLGVAIDSESAGGAPYKAIKDGESCGDGEVVAEEMQRFLRYWTVVKQLHPQDKTIQLTSMCRSPYGIVFGQYLDAVAHEWEYIRFYCAILRYREDFGCSNDSYECPEIERMVQCTAISEKYLSRGSRMYKALPAAIYSYIINRMHRPDASLFLKAEEWVVLYLCEHRWIPFKRAIIERADRALPLSIHPANEAMRDSGKEQYPLEYDTLILKLTHLVDKSLEQSEDSMHSDNPSVRGLVSANSALRESDADERVDGERCVTDADDVLLAEAFDGTAKVEGADVLDTDQPPSGHPTREISGNEMPTIRKPSTSDAEVIRFDQIMSHSKCCSLFKRFLDAERTSQTLLFLTEVEEYRIIPDYDFRQARARKIFNKYLHKKSLTPVPVTCATRRAVQELVAAKESHLHLFSQATIEVRSFIEFNQFPRFLLNELMISQINLLLRGSQSIATREPVGEQGRLVSGDDTLPSHRFFGDSRSLKDIIAFPAAMRFFREFCKRLLCTENLFFWLEAENYASMPGSDFRRRTAIKICKKYIDDNSKMQINISSATRRCIVQELDEPGRHIFLKAQQEVFRLMETDSFPRFLESREFKNMLNCFHASTFKLAVDCPRQNIRGDYIAATAGTASVEQASSLVKECANIWIEKCRSP